MAGPKGFEPLTFSLEGWHAIRTASRTHIKHSKWNASTYNFTYRLVPKSISVIILNTTQRSQNTKFSTFVCLIFLGAVDSSTSIKSRLHLINFCNNSTTHLFPPFCTFPHLFTPQPEAIAKPKQQNQPKTNPPKNANTTVVFYNWTKTLTTIFHLL